MLIPAGADDVGFTTDEVQWPREYCVPLSAKAIEGFMRHAYARLTAMKRNPHDGWTIGDLVSLCRTFGLGCERPTHGSHYTVHYPGVEGYLTIPARRRIKPIYIMLFVQLVESVW